jgi:hypothetical protein
MKGVFLALFLFQVWKLVFDFSSSVNVSDDNLAMEPPTPPTRTSEALKANLRAVNDHLEELKTQWEEEKTRLLGEKAILEDAAGRLNFQIKNTKADMKRASEGARSIATAKTNVQDVSTRVDSMECFLIVHITCRNLTKPRKRLLFLRRNSAQSGLVYDQWSESRNACSVTRSKS